MKHTVLAAVALAAATLGAPAASAPAQQPAKQSATKPARPAARPAASASAAGIIPITEFFDNPEISGAQISPDGKWLSFLKPYKGKLNVYVRPLGPGGAGAGGALASQGPTRLMTADTLRPVLAYFWSKDAKYLLYAQDKGGNENYRIYSVPVAAAPAASDGGAPAARDLTPYDKTRALIFDVPRETPNKIFIGLNKRDPSAFDAYWLDIETGALDLAVENPGRFAGVLLDRQQRARVALQQNTSGGSDIMVRDDDKSPWRTLLSVPATETAVPLRVHPDGKRLYVSTNHGETNTSRLVLVDMQTGAETVVDSDPKTEVDFGGAVFSDVTDSLLATVYVGDTVRIYPKDARFARDLARIRALHDGTPSVSSTTLDETKYMVAFDSPTDPGATYLYDRATGRGTFLFRPRPWLKTRTLAGMTPVSYKAADGLTIHGYLSTPPGAPARNLPLVLVVHGGPWARDTWGYDPEAQLLANRGYAVLQINYRGSTGYGKSFYNAGVHEWAGKMHTDLIDGVHWAVGRGIADPKKVGIYGGSYGGYATLVGLTFTPEMFACGVDYVGPSSLVTLIESFPAYWRPFMEGSWFRHVGDPSKPADREELLRRSPISRVDSIRVPLLIAQGANDPRVTKRESDQIAVALRNRGVKVKYLVAPDEGHGFANADNRLALYHSMELFLRDCLGGRAQDAVPAGIGQKIAQLTVNVDTLKLAAAPAAPTTTLAPGDASLDATKVTPGTTTLKLILVQNGQEQQIGTVTDELTATSVNGKPALRNVETVNAPMMGGTAIDSSVVLRDGFAPVSHRSVNAQRTLALDFSGPTVKGSITPKGGTAQAINYSGDAPLFDASVVGLLLRAAPLAEGYAVTIPAYIQEMGGKTSITARVTGSEPVDVGGKKVDAWVVEMNPAGRQVKQWVAKDTREIVRVSITPQPGIEIRAVK